MKRASFCALVVPCFQQFGYFLFFSCFLAGGDAFLCFVVPFGFFVARVFSVRVVSLRGFLYVCVPACLVWGPFFWVVPLFCFSLGPGIDLGFACGWTAAINMSPPLRNPGTMRPWQIPTNHFNHELHFVLRNGVRPSIKKDSPPKKTNLRDQEKKREHPSHYNIPTKPSGPQKPKNQKAGVLPPNPSSGGLLRLPCGIRPTQTPTDRSGASSAKPLLKAANCWWV